MERGRGARSWSAVVERARLDQGASVAEVDLGVGWNVITGRQTTR